MLSDKLVSRNTLETAGRAFPGVLLGGLRCGAPWSVPTSRCPRRPHWAVWLLGPVVCRLLVLPQLGSLVAEGSWPCSVWMEPGSVFSGKQILSCTAVSLSVHGKALPPFCGFLPLPLSHWRLFLHAIATAARFEDPGPASLLTRHRGRSRSLTSSGLVCPRRGARGPECRSHLEQLLCQAHCF